MHSESRFPLALTVHDGADSLLATIALELIGLFAMGATVLTILIVVPMLCSAIVRRRARRLSDDPEEWCRYTVSKPISIAASLASYSPAVLLLIVALMAWRARPSMDPTLFLVSLAFAVFGYCAMRRLSHWSVVVDREHLLVHRHSGVERIALCDVLAADCRHGRLVILVRGGAAHAIPAIFDQSHRILAVLTRRATENVFPLQRDCSKVDLPPKF